MTISSPPPPPPPQRPPPPPPPPPPPKVEQRLPPPPPPPPPPKEETKAVPSSPAKHPIKQPRYENSPSQASNNRPPSPQQQQQQQQQQHSQIAPPRPPPPPPPLQEGAPSFTDIVTNVLTETVEFRLKLEALTAPDPNNSNDKPTLTPHDIFAIRHDMENLMTHLYQPSLIPRNDAETEVRRSCQLKTADVALLALTTLTKYKPEPDPDDPTNDEEHAYNGEEEKQCQECIARIAELNLNLLEPEPEGVDRKEREDKIISVYSTYQKQVLRKRVKPSIARLVDYRKRQEEQERHHRHNGAQHHDSDSESEDEDEDASKSQHVRVVGTILGQAVALIFPLMEWKAGLPPQQTRMRELVEQSISLVDEQAQTMTQTVATWFLQDARVDENWMAKSANESSCLDQLGELDGVVEQMAYCCELFDRYIGLVHPEVDRQANPGASNGWDSRAILQQMHPEWTWKYASMERYLTTQQLQSALNLASPVQIVVGTPIQVPSVVEDAQYLSTRALRRAASTRSNQAIGTVAHSIASDVWSTEMANGVHEALVEQRGCYDENATTQNNTAAKNEAKSPSRGTNTSSSFAMALMGALDEDLADDKPTIKSPPMTPSSGGFLGSLSTSLASVGGGTKLDQIRLDTFLCALNGIHSASAACASLVHFLDSLLAAEDKEGVNKTDNSQNMSMVHLAREELFRYSRNYSDLLNEQSIQVVCTFCGSWQDAAAFKGGMFPVLRYYLERENYNLTSAEELCVAEDDAHLHKILIHPIQDSLLLRQFEKCDRDVLQVLCERVVQMLVDLFLDVILSKPPKKFTDWGSLLFSKQVRVVQNLLQTLMEKAASMHHQGAAPVLNAKWERLSQAVTILQLEKPSDWSFYQSTSVFSPEELQSILELRVDFAPDAIAVVVKSVSAKQG